jgi:hypothetical protein
MEITKKDRSTLKTYFAKNAMPTSGHFAELIDGLMNQKDDGLAKPADGPLSLQADGDNASQKKAINFYRNFSDPSPAWTLSLNPRVDPEKAETARPGWNIADAKGASRLFIDQSTGNVGLGTVDPGGYKLNVQGPALVTGNASFNGNASFAGNGSFNGNVGIGTTAPVSQLDVAQVARTNPANHPQAVKGLYVTGDFGADADGVEFRHSNGSQGIGFGHNTIYAAGSNASQDLNLKPKAGSVRISGGLAVTSGQAVTGIPIVDFQSQDQEFAKHNGSTKKLTYAFTFTRPVLKAEPMLKAWFLSYVGREYVKDIGVSCGSASISGNTVKVEVTFALKDNSGNYDDDYGGNATVVVVAHLSQTL